MRLFTTLPLAVAYLTVLTVIPFVSLSVLSVPTGTPPATGRPRTAGSGPSGEYVHTRYYTMEFSTLILDVLLSAGQIAPSEILKTTTKQTAAVYYSSIETEALKRIKEKIDIIRRSHTCMTEDVKALLDKTETYALKRIQPQQRQSKRIVTFFKTKFQAKSAPTKPLAKAEELSMAARDALGTFAEDVIKAVKGPRTPPAPRPVGASALQCTPGYVAALGAFLHRVGRISTLAQLTGVDAASSERLITEIDKESAHLALEDIKQLRFSQTVAKGVVKDVRKAFTESSRLFT